MSGLNAIQRPGLSSPRCVILSGNRGTWNYADRIQEAWFTNGVEAWVYALNADYIGWADLETSRSMDHDLVISNTNLKPEWLSKALYLAERRSSTTKWVCLIEGGGHDYRLPNHLLQQQLDAADLVLSINRYTTGFLQALTNTPVRYLGIPYPFDEIRRLRTPRSERNGGLWLCGNMLRSQAEVLASNGHPLKRAGSVPRMSRKPRTLFESLKKTGSLNVREQRYHFDELYGPNDIAVEFQSELLEFLQSASRYEILLNLDDRYTWGRYVLDAGALGIPCICTKNTGHAEFLFPDLCLDSWLEVGKARHLLQRLASDPQFYDQTSQVPESYYDQFRHDIMREKLFSILGLT